MLGILHNARQQSDSKGERPACPLAGLSRRAAMTAALTASLSFRPSECLADVTAGTGQPPADLIERTEAQAVAFMRGEMERWSRMVNLADDFTLMQPFGGPASRGFDASPERLAQLAKYFGNGDAKLEVVQSYGSNDLVVLVMIERQHGEVGGLPDQDWSLRVTQVYRKHGAEWQLVHRHADPLVRNIGLEATAAIARGARLGEKS
jgi:ketosteroid isomerase-like protein